jgi:hypothetical protein
VGREVFYLKEPVYAVLINAGNTTVRLGSWEVRDIDDNVVYSTEPAQIDIPPGSSITAVWFQIDNEREQVKRGKYRIAWRSSNGECTSDYFEIH